MKKRIISLLMALLMLTSLLPTAVWAEGEAPEQAAAAVTDDGAAEQEPAATPETPETPEAPEAPVEPEQPAAPEIPETPETPAIPEEPEVPTVPQTPADETQGEDEGIRVEDDGDWLDGGMCGAKVEWMVSTDYRLFIWGSGEMDDFTYDDNGNNTRPWEQYRERIWYFAVQDNVTHIGAYAFAEMHLSSFNLTNAIVSIGEGAFENTSYEWITFSGKLTTIGEDAFRQSWNLTTITLPGTLKSISDCFWQCYSLQTIKFGGTSAQWEAAGGDNIYLPLGTTVQCTDRNLTRSYSGQSEDGLNWKLTHDGTLTISGSGPMTDYELYPDSPFSNAPWGEHYWRIKKIVISEGVTHVGDVAFCHGQSVASVSLPSTLISIGWSSFFSCQSLSDITIPASVTKIGPEAFFQYSDNGAFHTDIHYKGTAQQWYQAGGNSAYNPQFTTVYCQGKALSTTSGQCGDNVTWYFADGTLTIKGSGAMWDYPTSEDDSWWMDWALPWKYYYEAISRIVVAEGITHIGAYAFYCTDNATALSLPDSLTSIGRAALCGFGGTEIIVPDNVTCIDNFAFNGCDNLKTVSLPAGLQNIGICFIECDALKTINFGGTMEQWLVCGGGESTFPAQTQVVCASGTLSRNGKCGNNLTWTLDSSGKLTISGTGDMSDYTHDFENNIRTSPWADYRSMIRSIEIGSGVTRIGSYAFEDTNITSLTIPGSVTAIGDYGFNGNRYLAELTLQSGLKSIGKEAFSCSKRLTTVTIPDGVTTIGEEAFVHCWAWLPKADTYVGLSTVSIPGSVTSIGKNAFDDNQELLTTVNFDGTQEQWNAIGGKDSGMPDTATINYVTVVGSGSCGAGVTWSLTSTGVLTIGGSGAVTQIPWQKETVTEVVVFEGVTSLCNHAFTRQPVTRVTLPDSLTAIGTMAFAGCQMEELYLPRNLKTVGVEAFTGCAELKYLDMDKNCAVTLGDMSFKLCTALEAVHLSANIKLGEGVFAGCSNLEEVLFEGSGKQWLDLRSGLNFHVVTLECRGGGFGSGKCGDNLTWELDGSGLLTISGTGRMYDYQDTEDDTPEGPNSPWTFTADGTFLTPYIHEIKINYGVTHIGDTAFKYCHYVDDITIPGSVTSIGESAFRRCDILRNVTIPNTVTSIGANAFLNDDRLSAIYFSGTESQWNTLSQNIGLPDGVNIEYVKLGIITSGGAEPNVGDMQALYESLTGQKDLIYKQQMAADVNQDGEIDVYDLQRLYEAVNRINPL